MKNIILIVLIMTSGCTIAEERIKTGMVCEVKGTGKTVTVQRFREWSYDFWNVVTKDLKVISIREQLLINCKYET